MHLFLFFVYHIGKVELYVYVGSTCICYKFVKLCPLKRFTNAIYISKIRFYLLFLFFVSYTDAPFFSRIIYVLKKRLANADYWRKIFMALSQRQHESIINTLLLHSATVLPVISEY